MDPRQVAAIRRKKADDRRAREQAEERARLGLVLGADANVAPVTVPDAVVGWADFRGPFVKGFDHVCITCSPTKPRLTFKAIHRFRLAAREACTRCGTVLEAVQR